MGHQRPSTYPHLSQQRAVVYELKSFDQKQEANSRKVLTMLPEQQSKWRITRPEFDEIWRH